MAIAPAEPSVSSSSINMGQSVTITHSSPSSIGIKRYTITWSFAGHSGTLATQTADTSTVWTPALATFAAYIPNAVSGVATITCATYDLSESSSSPVGTKSCTVTLLVPSSVKPTLSNVSVSEGNTSLPSAFSGNYVKGYSKLKLSFTASGANGSTIKSARYTCDGKTYTSTYSAATVNDSITSDTLTQAGTGKSVSVTVTDSRGRTASQTIGSLTFKDYSVPQITSFKTRRSSGNTASATGTNAQRYIAANVTAVGTNSITSAVLSWKQKNASVWATSDKVTIASSGTAIPSSGSAAWTVIAKSGANVTFDGLYSYDFKLEVTDKAGNTTTSFTYISTVSVMLDFNDSGTGLGIGMINQNTYSIDSAWTYRGTSISLSSRVEIGASAYIEAFKVWNESFTGQRANAVLRADNTWQFTEYTTAGADPREMYLLPAPTSTNASGDWYDILTSKNAVTVDQGGTGATDAATARTNLGITPANIGALPISGGTLTGALTLATAGLNTASTAGFTLNQYGNFIHRRNTATDTWNIMANDNTVKIAIVPESGNITSQGSISAGGAVSATGNVSSGGNVSATGTVTADGYIASSTGFRMWRGTNKAWEMSINALPANTDLNDLTTPGIYFTGGYNNMRSLAHMPASEYATIIVTPSVDAQGGSYCKQIWIGNNAVWFSNRNNGTWGAWINLVDGTNKTR